jgi:hypothetical protein
MIVVKVTPGKEDIAMAVFKKTSYFYLKKFRKDIYFSKKKK